MKIEGDYAIIETAEEARFFYVENAFADYGIGKIPRAQVLEAITPKEGDAVFYFYNPPTASWSGPNPWTVFYSVSLSGTIQAYATYVKANALTIGKNVGKLRELLAWCSP